MKKLIVAAVFAALPMMASAASNLIENGSFEDTSYLPGDQQLAANSWTTFNLIPGWITTSGHSIEVRYNVAGSAQDGNQFVELDSYGNSAMGQVVLTDAGTRYDLSFWYSPRPGTGDTNDIQVSWNGVQLGATLTGTNGSGSHQWTQYSFSVMGTGADNLIFAATGVNDSYGGSLDNVALTAAVPEPETYAMMLAGLGMMGVIARRRRSAV